MRVTRVAGQVNAVDVFDRVLDKGIVIDAWVSIYLMGIGLLTVDARVVVASIETYLQHAGEVGATKTVACPAPSTRRPGLTESLGTPHASAPHPTLPLRRPAVRPRIPNV